ncbi:hypothetical protein [Tumebacillus permanentifrigoris]|nr:hypothetical protein [Tumebacillus permanentifrigoris]
MNTQLFAIISAVLFWSWRGISVVARDRFAVREVELGREVHRGTAEAIADREFGGCVDIGFNGVCIVGTSRRCLVEFQSYGCISCSLGDYGFYGFEHSGQSSVEESNREGRYGSVDRVGFCVVFDCGDFQCVKFS